MDAAPIHDQARDLYVVPIRHHSPACAVHLLRLDRRARIGGHHGRRIAEIEIEIFDNGCGFDHHAAIVIEDGELSSRSGLLDEGAVFRMILVAHHEVERHIALISGDGGFPEEGSERVAVNAQHAGAPDDRRCDFACCVRARAPRGLPRRQIKGDAACQRGCAGSNITAYECMAE